MMWFAWLATGETRRKIDVIIGKLDKLDTLTDDLKDANATLRQILAKVKERLTQTLHALAGARHYPCGVHDTQRRPWLRHIP